METKQLRQFNEEQPLKKMLENAGGLIDQLDDNNLRQVLKIELETFSVTTIVSWNMLQQQMEHRGK